MCFRCFVNKIRKGNFIMPIVAFTVALFLGISSPEYQEFRKHSNGNAAYSITLVDPCETGLRETGYALAPAKFILFKQKPLDSRETGPVCGE